MRVLKKAGYILGWWTAAGILGAILLASSGFLYLSPKLPSAESYRDIRLENPLRIFSSDGKLIAEFGDKKRDPIKIQDVPPIFINALIASEDSRFYRHNGVDLRALARSVTGILTGNDSGGGSTLTMQIAKNISFEGEDPYSRKFKEILLALQIEKELSKEEILELYLNRIFWGISAYGIAAASRQYYDKAPEDLSLAEMAMLVAILPAPNRINPLRAPELALSYRARVLRRMHQLGMIDRGQYEIADSSPITAQRYGRDTELAASYVAELVRQEVVARYGERAIDDGYEVYTTIDSRMQETATQALRHGLEVYDRRHGYRGPEQHLPPAPDGSQQHWLALLQRSARVGNQVPAIVKGVEERGITALLADGSEVDLPWEGIRWAKPFLTNSTWGRSPRDASEVAKVGDLIRVTRDAEGGWQLGQVPAVNGGLVALDPNDGAIRALVGGYDFFASKFNRVMQAKRQPGSNFKPFLYTAALENGYTAASLINDAPLARSDYRPKNFDGGFNGPTRLKYALTQSKNLVSLRLFDALGNDVVLPYYGRFGFDASQFPRNDLTVAIGSHAVTPLEIARGYTVFANGGYLVDPYLIERISNFNDGEIYHAQPPSACPDCATATVAAPPPAPLLSSPAALANLAPPPVEPAPPAAPRVIDERAAYIMNTMLRSVITSGSGRPANRAIGRGDLAGKTGTTNDAADLWFSGYTGHLVASVYVGYDQPQTLGDEQAATVALPIWIDFMKPVLEDLPEKTMVQPDGIVTVRINPQTGLLARPDEPGAIFEVFREEDVPGYGSGPAQANPGGGATPRQSTPVNPF